MNSFAAYRRLAAVLFLGFASGLPLALTGQAMQAWLSMEGLDVATIGFLSLVGIPYTFKFLWAPLMDRFEPPWLNNSNEELSLSQDVITKRRSYQHQEALHKEELNSREEYLKAKEDYDLAVKKHALISKRLKKDAQLRRSQMDQMGDNLEAMQKNVQLVRQRKEKLNIRSTISGEIGYIA